MANEDTVMNLGDVQAADKRRAIVGADRERMDELRSQIDYLKAKLTLEHQRRRDVEKTCTEAVRLETEQYVVQFETACKKYYTDQNDALGLELGKANALVADMRAVLAAGAAEYNAQQERMVRPSPISAMDEFKLAAEEAIATQKAAHEKEIAEKSAEIMALMAKLRATSTFTPAAQEAFPGTAPPLIPRFLTAATRKKRVTDKIVKTSSTRIPVIPLQPPPASGAEHQIPDQLGDFDLQNDESVNKMTEIIRQVLAEMGIEGVQVRGAGRKKKRAPAKLSLAVKQQQASMTEEEDLLDKRGLRETWRTTYETASSDDFRAYVPAPAILVEACNDGGAGPAPTDYTLDFGEGYMTSLWNKKIIGKLVQGFFAARAASENGWGLPEVSVAYVEGELYGQLKRSQQAWALWRPRFSLDLGRPETADEATRRADGYRAGRQSRVNGRAGKANKLARRNEIVRKVLEIKMIRQDPDLKLWQFFKTILNLLDLGGMSSEDGGVRDMGGITTNVFIVKLCVWRASTVTDYLRIIDETGSKLKPRSKAFPRVREINGPQGTSVPPKGLPRKMYDANWLSKMQADYIEELEISEDAFEFMVAATSSIIV
ncbi:hypothetical protein B0H19DRAFT_1322045 [Mycena capillaripes]|nr:hypothetical protein B0H19DRAFT_1322045 [Mycena capillaripes]